MKKKIAFVLVLTMLLALSACGIASENMDSKAKLQDILELTPI